VEPQASAVGPIDAAENLDQGRLAGAVLAAQRMDLAARAGEADPIERPHAGKALADREHFESERRLRHVCRPPFARAYSAAIRPVSIWRLRGSRCILPSFMIIAKCAGPTRTDWSAN